MHGGAERYRSGSGNVCRGRRRGMPGLGHTAVFIQGAEKRGADPQALEQARFGSLSGSERSSGGEAGRPGSCLLSPPLLSIQVLPSDSTLKRVLPGSSCHGNTVNKE